MLRSTIVGIVAVAVSAASALAGDVQSTRLVAEKGITVPRDDIYELSRKCNKTCDAASEWHFKTCREHVQGELKRACWMYSNEGNGACKRIC